MRSLLIALMAMALMVPSMGISQEDSQEVEGKIASQMPDRIQTHVETDKPTGIHGQIRFRAVLASTVAQHKQSKTHFSTTPTEPSIPQANPPIPDVWIRLAECESGEWTKNGFVRGSARWDINTGNGYYGGIQFSLRSWRWVGGEGYPHEHPPHVQVEMGKRLLERQGWGAWPACSRRLGLR